MLTGLCFPSFHPLADAVPKGSPALVDGGAAASPEPGGGGTGGKGPMGGHSGNMPGGKGGRRPWGTAERRLVVRKGPNREIQVAGRGLDVLCSLLPQALSELSTDHL